jgi:hypothetical protein
VPGETSSTTPTNVRFEGDKFWVDLSDGRTLGVPLSWFPVLQAATAQQRAVFWVSSRGLHWDELDEDISVEGLLEGRRDMTNRGKRMKIDAAE